MVWLNWGGCESYDSSLGLTGYLETGCLSGAGHGGLGEATGNKGPKIQAELTIGQPGRIEFCVFSMLVKKISEIGLTESSVLVSYVCTKTAVRTTVTPGCACIPPDKTYTLCTFTENALSSSPKPQSKTVAHSHWAHRYEVVWGLGPCNSPQCRCAFAILHGPHPCRVQVIDLRW